MAVEGPRYYSSTDEDVFFRWLQSIPSVQAVGGVGTELEISFRTRRIPGRDLREVLAIFHRYRLDKRPLAQFDRGELSWFRDPEAYWHAEVFG